MLVKIYGVKSSTSGLKWEIILCVAAPCESYLVAAHLRIWRGVKPSDSCAFSSTENLMDEYVNIFHRIGGSWSSSCKPLNPFSKCTNTSASQWFWQLMYFIWGDEWHSHSCSSVISPLMLFAPSKPLNRILPNPIPLSQKRSEIFSQIWAAPLFPLICTSPKYSSFTSLESLSTYLTKVANSALLETSVVSSAKILKSVAFAKWDKSQ